MKNPQIKTKGLHSSSKKEWKVIGTTLGAKYKIAIVPYVDTEETKEEAFQHAEFISQCFNNSDVICKLNL
jgi:hypothetical protein